MRPCVSHSLPILSAGALGMALVLTACGRGRDVFPEAEALEKDGKLAEAAARFDLACAYAPAGPRCAQADARAFEARMKAAEADVARGRFVDGERMFREAAMTADEAGQKRIQERLAQDDLTLGVRYERALTLPDKQRTAAALQPIAASSAPVAARAKEWLAKEAPTFLALAVKAACGPDHEGSCTEAFAKLQAAAAAGPEADDARRAAEAEQRRVAPLRGQAERFVRVFASQGQKQKTFDKCLADKAQDGSDPAAFRGKCEEDAFGADPDDKRYQRDKNNANLWRRLLKQIADPAIARDLEARKARALSEGDAPATRSP